MVVAAVAFAVLWFVLLLAASLVDEDVNHWNWPSDGGPGRVAKLRMGALTALLAAAVVGLACWALDRV